MPEPIYKMMGDFFQALAHPTRIEILELLKIKEQMCVCEIVPQLKKDQSNISRHLNALRQVGLVEFRGEGVRSFYRVKNKEIYKILDSIRTILRQEIKKNQEILAAF